MALKKEYLAGDGLEKPPWIYRSLNPSVAQRWCDLCLYEISELKCCFNGSQEQIRAECCSG